LIALLTRLSLGPSSHMVRAPVLIATGIALSVGLFVTTSAYDTHNVRRVWQREAYLRQAAIKSAVHARLEALASVQRLFASSNAVDAAEFATFVAPSLNRGGDLLAYDWAPRVTDGERDAFERAMPPGSGHLLTSRGPGQTLLARAKHAVYFPVLFVEPEWFASRVLGYDHYSDPLRRAAMDEAARTGEPRSCGLVKPFRVLVHESAEDLLVFVPSFAKNGPVHADSAADPAIDGFVVGIIRFTRLVENALALYQQGDFHVQITEDRGGPKGVTRAPALWLDASPAEVSSWVPTERSIDTIEIAGTRLRLELWPTTQLIDREHEIYPTLILAGSLLATVLTALYVYQLGRLRDQAMEASSAKSRFLASMSHELRTPMTAIVGMTELLEDTPLMPNQADYVKRLRRAGAHLLTVISDILDVSKIEAGAFEMEHITFDVDDLMDTILELMLVPAIDKGLKLDCFIAPDVPRQLVGDPTRLRQVIVNLIGNAMKFTATGGVFIRVEWARSNDAAALHVTVRDTGIGIPPDKLDTIFESFSQVDASTTRNYGGTGLGLNISRHIVERMGGVLWADSDIGSGSTFTFIVYLDVAPDETGFGDRRAIVDGRRILIVDGHENNRAVLRDTLTPLGAIVVEAGDADAGLAAWLQARRDGQLFDAVLIDSHMPGQNGFQLASELRRMAVNERAIVLMLSSDSRSTDVQRCQELGIATYLVKPILRLALLQALHDVLVGHQHAAAAAVVETMPDAVTAAMYPLSILIADDNEDNRTLLSKFLEGTPHRLTLVQNGAAAVEACMAGDIDLVLMDVHMPIMDGYTATRSLRAWEREHRRAPLQILALTANALRDDFATSREAGCDGHLTKPIKKKTLLAVIAEQATRKASAA
jgi:signal transduction histidine kinase/CheY-like chemotaxis protein